jgi:TetR/AcrR family transcriptional repressor of nem operon
MKETTKQKLIQAGAQIIHQKGYNYAGIQEILKTAEVPKGSFYFYFKNKEDFGLQVIEYFNGFYFEKVNPILSDESIPPLERIKQVLDGFIELFTFADYTLGCPIGNLAQEMGDLSPAFRQKLQESVQKMVDYYDQVLQEAKQAGDMPLLLDTREIADFIVSSWHGALVRMKIEKSAKPLENHKLIILKVLEAALPYY